MTRKSYCSRTRIWTPRSERPYCTRHPLSTGLAIVSGTYNGRAEGFYQHLIHYSGAINAGMSGGPAVDTDGAVMGVNVAVLREAQLIGLLIPEHFVRDLMKAPPVVDSTSKDFWQQEVGRQVHAYGATVMALLNAKPLPLRQFGAYRSADIEPLGFKCSGNHIDATGRFRHETEGRSCRRWRYLPRSS